MTRHASRAALAALLLATTAPVAAAQRPAPARPHQAPPPVTAPAAPAPGAPAAIMQQRAQLEKIIHRQVLPNGMDVIVVENHGVPLATVEIDVKNGSFTQTPEFEGLSHLYEHMFFKANADYPEPEEFVQRAAELGAVFNATTREEVVNYYVTVSADSLEGAMRFLNSAFRAPLFRKDELDREREVVIGEYDRQESSPFFRFNQEMGKHLWTTQWSRKNTIGARDVVQSTTPDQMREIEHRYYVPNNAALIVAGDVQPDKVFALAQRVFGDMPRGADPFVRWPIPDVPPLAANDALIVEEPNVSTVFVMLQWIGPNVQQDPDATYAADVFSDVLNQDGSKFQQRLVDSGLWSSVVVNYYTLNHGGPITISGETSPDKLREALAALEGEIAKFDQPGYIGVAELEPTKQQRAVGTALGLERASGFAHELGFWWAVAGLDYYMGYVDNMARRTAADLRAYAQKYIVGKPHVTGVLLSPQARQQSGITRDGLIKPSITSTATEGTP